jgi:hypothetical protein
MQKHWQFGIAQSNQIQDHSFDPREIMVSLENIVNKEVARSPSFSGTTNKCQTVVFHHNIQDLVFEGHH